MRMSMDVPMIRAASPIPECVRRPRGSGPARSVALFWYISAGFGAVSVMYSNCSQTICRTFLTASISPCVHAIDVWTRDCDV